MAYRTGTRSDLNFPPSRRPRDYDDDDFYERQSDSRSQQPRRAPPVRDYEEIDISLRDRERNRASDRTPHFLREDRQQRPTAGPLVLRQKESESFERRRPRSISSSRSDERRSVRYPRRPEPTTDVHVDIDTRISNRRRRSPTPEREREIRIIERERERERIPSPSPSPPPPPPEPLTVRGPTLEREVITHYTDIDHGVVRAKPPSPSPPPPPRPRSRMKERETDIDITFGRHETDVDIHRRARSRSRPAERPKLRPHSSHRDSYRDVYREHTDIEIDRDGVIVSERSGRRRAHSAAPQPRHPDYDDEADYITGKIDSRGRMGEAWNGATKDWTIVDVPPGTERVHMDGVGGGSADVTWQRYNGVRRARFVPERDDTPHSGGAPLNEPLSSSRERDLSVQIYNKSSPEKEVEFDEVVHDRRISIRDREGSRAPPASAARKQQKERDMWTEITKDLVCREAIEELGYDYEETEYFFYVMQYLRYEDVLELVNISDEMRKRYRRQKERQQLEYERDVRDTYTDRRYYHHHDHHYRLPRRTIPSWDEDGEDERYEVERKREYIYDRGPVRPYAR